MFPHKQKITHWIYDIHYTIIRKNIMSKFSNKSKKKLPFIVQKQIILKLNYFSPLRYVRTCEFKVVL